MKALLTCSPAPEYTLSTLFIAFALGVPTALVMMVLDRWVFATIPSVAELIHNVAAPSRVRGTAFWPLSRVSLMRKC